jgi:hypothetical protein
MPTKTADDDDAFDLPGKQVRLDLTLTQADYARLRTLASTADITKSALVSMAFSIGLNALSGSGGLDVIEGLAMMRFLRGKPSQ